MQILGYFMRTILLTFFLLLAFFKTDIQAKSFAPLNPTQISLAKERQQHIVNRHINRHNYPEATKFASDWDEQKVVRMIHYVISNPKTEWHTKSDKYVAEYSYAKPIGKDKNGQAAKHLRIVIALNGYIVTAHPVTKKIHN